MRVVLFFITQMTMDLKVVRDQRDLRNEGKRKMWVAWDSAQRL